MGTNQRSTSKAKTMSEKNQLDCIALVLEGITETSTIGIFTHRFPDPDAISSMMALRWVIQKLTGAKVVDLIYEGKISHPQNQVVDNLLEPNLKDVDELEDIAYNKCFLVDTVPDNAGCGQFKDIRFDLVIDHHKEPPKIETDNYINLHAGSCASTIYQIIKKNDLTFDPDSEIDKRVVSGILVGIATDTDTLCSPDTTKLDVLAWSELLEYRDPDTLARILNYEKPKLWVEKKAEIFPQVKIVEGLAVVGIGVIDNKHRDLIADIADDIRSWEEVNTAVVFALIDGSSIEGSIRSCNSAISVPNLSKKLGSGKGGAGGGKAGKGAYKYNLGGSSIDEHDSPEIKELTWALFDKKEKERVFQIIRG